MIYRILCLFFKLESLLLWRECSGWVVYELRGEYWWVSFFGNKFGVKNFKVWECLYFLVIILDFWNFLKEKNLKY